MAKFKPNYKKLQREMLERIANQRRNKTKWTSSLGLLSTKDRSILEANDVIYSKYNRGDK